MVETPQHFLKKIRKAKEQKLKGLDLSNDWRTDDNEKLKEIPAEVFELEWLEVLDLSYNQITTIPEAIAHLQQLTILNIRNNQITTIPEAIAHLQQLSFLDLRDNQVTTLPEAIASLEQITNLDLRGNQITTLPEAIASLEQLKYLDLNSNQITALSEAIAHLPQLEYLGLSYNPIKKPPPEIVAQGIAPIRDYFRQLQAEGTDYLYEAKLLIVGEAGAGKTTLAKKIADQNYQLQEEESTKGIEVSQWGFPMENGRKFRVNIWDFAGQEINHATHQFFLTKRSLYALVADNRKEDTDFYYWLNVVELLSGNSPVLIIKNEKGDRTREINEPQLKGQFNDLKETLATNLAKNDQRLKNIIKEIKHQITSLPHLGTPLPKTWVKVREALESDPRNYISLDEYLNICQQNGFTKHEDKLQLSGYLHDLGVCLHFQNDRILEKTLILKPKWGTDAVYRVLDDPQVINNLGKFTWEDLKKIWQEQEYDQKQNELLQLMINFKLCYEIPKHPQTYIAPQLLTAKQPEYQWDETNNLILRYSYEFMPKGIITQFIVAMHNLIDVMDGQQFVWKSGVILSQEEREKKIITITKAEIIEYYDKREIKIRVAGTNKRDLMTTVTYELDKIHQSYNKRPKYDKLIPCNCITCKDSQEPHFYKFDNLRQRFVNQKYQIECDKPPYETVNVLSLIDDVMDRRELEPDKTRDLVSHPSVTFAGNIEKVVIQHSTEGNNIMTEPQKPEEPSKSEVQVTLPWAFRNGMFYLFVCVVIFTLIGTLGGFLPFHYLALTIIGTAIFIILIGVLQLRQDDRLSEKSFVELTKMVMKQFPLIGNLIESFKGNK